MLFPCNVSSAVLISRAMLMAPMMMLMMLGRTEEREREHFHARVIPHAVPFPIHEHNYRHTTHHTNTLTTRPYASHRENDENLRDDASVFPEVQATHIRTECDATMPLRD